MFFRRNVPVPFRERCIRLFCKNSSAPESPANTGILVMKKPSSRKGAPVSIRLFLFFLENKRINTEAVPALYSPLFILYSLPPASRLSPQL